LAKGPGCFVYIDLDNTSPACRLVWILHTVAILLKLNTISHGDFNIYADDLSENEMPMALTVIVL
jgi:hypothetical protein